MSCPDGDHGDVHEDPAGPGSVDAVPVPLPRDPPLPPGYVDPLADSTLLAEMAPVRGLDTQASGAEIDDAKGDPDSS
ncbi:hypothetical protein GCM10027080_29710 [Pedococcus soli]